MALFSRARIAVVLWGAHEDSAVWPDDVRGDGLFLVEPSPWFTDLGAGLPLELVLCEVIEPLKQSIESLAGVVHTVQRGDLAGDAHGHGGVRGVGADGVAGRTRETWQGREGRECGKGRC